MPNFIWSEALIEKLAPIIGVEYDNIHRVVIDLECGDVPIVYVQLIGDSRLLEIDWPGELSSATIRFSDKEVKKDE